MKSIKLKIISDKKDVKAFLNELKSILNDEKFSVEKQFRLVRTLKDNMQYSTRYTMVDLDYSAIDIVERLRELTINEYSETLLDKDDCKPPLLFVFGKYINEKLVYIKLKIKGDATKFILCVSFHYAEWDMQFPYVHG